MRSVPLIQKLSPSIIVSLVALTIIALLIIGRFVGGAESVEPKVTYRYTQDLSSTRKLERRMAGVVALMDGEVAHTAERIDAACTLALAATTYAARQALQNRNPRTVDEVITGIISQGLLPVDLKKSGQSGAFTSPYGPLYIRYRPTPLGVEVISLASNPKDGPAMIVRIPEATTDNSAGFFVSMSLTNITVPPPFAPASEIVTLGWAPERLRSAR